MDDRQQPSRSSEAPAAAAEVSERIRVVLAEAESAANAIRHQAEQEAQSHRRQAETDSLRIIEDARREAERFLAERIRAVSELSDELLARGQAVVERLDEADAVRSQLAGLVTALGDTAARLGNEVRAMPGPTPPSIVTDNPDYTPAAAPSPVESVAPEPVAPPEPDPEPEPPLVEPTPLRREQPSVVDEPPAAAEFDPDEAELLEQVRRAERERAFDGESGEPRPGEAARAANAGVSGEQGLEQDEDDDLADPVHEEPEPEERASEVVALRVPEPETETEPDLEPEPEPEPEPAAEAELDAEDRNGNAAPTPDTGLGARLVALQMAVAGGNRGEVEAHLRRAFNLDDPSAILDDIFGSGTDSDKRVVWPEAAG